MRPAVANARSLILASIAVYVIALFLPAVWVNQPWEATTSHVGSAWPGWACVVYGIFAPQYEIANIFLWIAWLLAFRRMKGAMILSGLAAADALVFMSVSWFGGDGHGPFVGAYLWLLAMVLALVASFPRFQWTS